MNHLKSNLDKFVTQLAKANYTKREIKYTNKNDLLLIWGKIISIPDINKNKKHYTNKKIGYVDIWDTATIPMYYVSLQ